MAHGMSPSTHGMDGRPCPSPKILLAIAVVPLLPKSMILRHGAPAPASCHGDSAAAAGSMTA
jgi:hypothetical protein